MLPTGNLGWVLVKLAVTNHTQGMNQFEGLQTCDQPHSRLDLWASASCWLLHPLL